MRLPHDPTKIFFTAWFLFLLLGLMVFSVGMYVVFHFIAKFW